MRATIAGVLLAALAAPALGFQFDLAAGKAKCFSETMERQSLTVGAFQAKDTALTSAGLQVEVITPKGAKEFSKPDISTGKFAFTTTEEGAYRFCFTNPSTAQRRVEFDFRSGLHANDASRAAKTEQLQPLEAELLKLEGQAGDVLKTFEYLQEREAEHRNTNESTNTRVLWFTVLSIVLLVALTVFQVVVLQRSLAKEKLIDSRPIFMS